MWGAARYDVGKGTVSAVESTAGNEQMQRRRRAGPRRGAKKESPRPVRRRDSYAISCNQSGRVDLNHRPPGPEPGALTGLRHAPKYPVMDWNRGEGAPRNRAARGEIRISERTRNVAQNRDLGNLRGNATRDRTAAAGSSLTRRPRFCKAASGNVGGPPRRALDSPSPHPHTGCRHCPISDRACRSRSPGVIRSSASSAEAACRGYSLPKSTVSADASW